MIGVVRNDYRSWGGTLRASHRVVRPHSTDKVVQVLRDHVGVALAYGCGRSYGDAALNPDGLLIDCRSLDRFIAFDRSSGRLECEAGLQLADILTVVCRPEEDGSGWFLPVSPGTRFVTVGGAIASDVHGKNHHRSGTFGSHVLSLELARSDGSVSVCSLQDNASLFQATLGGLGLTGIILCATIQLRRVNGLALELENIRFDSLNDFWDLSTESDGAWEYTAAWVDTLANGQSFGRGIFSRARHSAGLRAEPPPRAPTLTVFMTPPVSLVNRYTTRGFNAIYWRCQAHGPRFGNYEALLYPLDALGLWNRLYGPAGFFQFQCVIPPADAREGISELLRCIVDSGEGSMLALLKSFGALPSPGLLSFPMPGVTLALDFPNRGAATRKLLAHLEYMVMEMSGRIYPAKDCLMQQDSFLRGYPRLSEFLPLMDPGLSSAFARRVGLVKPQERQI